MELNTTMSLFWAILSKEFGENAGEKVLTILLNSFPSRASKSPLALTPSKFCKTIGRAHSVEKPLRAKMTLQDVSDLELVFFEDCFLDGQDQ